MYLKTEDALWFLCVILIGVCQIGGSPTPQQSSNQGVPETPEDNPNADILTFPTVRRKETLPKDEEATVSRVPSKDEDVDCPSPGVVWKGICYQYFPLHKYYWRAAEYCEEVGGRLADISQSTEIVHELWDLFGEKAEAFEDNGFWVGAHATRYPESFTCNSPEACVEFWKGFVKDKSVFAKKEPNNSTNRKGGTCGNIRRCEKRGSTEGCEPPGRYGRLYDSRCEKPLGFVCQFDRKMSSEGCPGPFPTISGTTIERVGDGGLEYGETITYLCPDDEEIVGTCRGTLQYALSTGFCGEVEKKEQSSPTSAIANDECRAPGILWDGNCYMYFNRPRNFWDAAANCDRRGGRLADVSQGKKVIQQLWANFGQRALDFGYPGFWVGAHSRRYPGSWFCSSRATCLKYWKQFVPDESVWATWEPNNVAADEGCAVVRADGLWDQPCSIRMGYICQMDRKLSSEGCGQRSPKLPTGITKRISGGMEANPGDWPWAAALFQKPQHRNTPPTFICGGVVLGKRHVLTAAHCIIVSENYLIVRLGEYNLTDGNETSVAIDFDVERTVVHERYNPRSIHHDIAIVVLKKRAKFTCDIWNICFPVTINPPEVFGTKATIIGWGATEEKSTSDVLNEVSVTVYSELECASTMRYFKAPYTSKSMVCARVKGGHGDSCLGDSGGPLMVEHQGAWFVIGIVSAGEDQLKLPIPCPEPFTKVGDHCYYLAKDGIMKWNNAKARCIAMGGYLAELETHEEIELVKDYLTSLAGRACSSFLGSSGCNVFLLEPNSQTWELFSGPNQGNPCFILIGTAVNLTDLEVGIAALRLISLASMHVMIMAECHEETDGCMILEKLCSSQKLERDRAETSLKAWLKQFSGRNLFRRSVELLKTEMEKNDADAWLSLHGSLLSVALILAECGSVDEENADTDRDLLVSACLDCQTHPEVRVRLAAGQLLGSAAKALGAVQVHQLSWDPMTDHLRRYYEESMEAEAGWSNSGSSSETEGRPRTPNNWEILQEHASVGRLDTGLRSMTELVNGCGKFFTKNMLSQEFLSVTFKILWTHSNRFIKEEGYRLLHALISCSVFCSDDPNQSETIRELSRLLAKGLADNWSQVRLMSSVAARTFLLLESSLDTDQARVFLADLLPRICLNRYYVAEGVKLYSKESWRLVTNGRGKELVAAFLKDVVDYYIVSTRADNHAVREAACACIAELAAQVPANKLRPFVEPLLEALVESFKDDSWPVRDAACRSCGDFVQSFPKDIPESVLDQILTLSLENLRDSVASVRQGAADSIAQCLQCIEEPCQLRIKDVIRERFLAVEQQPVDEIRDPLDRPTPRDLTEEDPRHTDQTMYSCGSLAPKMGRGDALIPGGCTHNKFRRDPHPWEVSDGALRLTGAIFATQSRPPAPECRMGGLEALGGASFSLPPAAKRSTREADALSPLCKQFEDLIPETLGVVRRKDFQAHVALQETLARQIPLLADGLGRRIFKTKYLDLFLTELCPMLNSSAALTQSAAKDVLIWLGNSYGPNIIIGRVGNLPNCSSDVELSVGELLRFSCLTPGGRGLGNHGPSEQASAFLQRF
ncbi:unnamed protein product [Cyprideis torosa]|uniref:Uncharacterized protein n=1 Tax=Cyprideis torosa TaxID=163714 RepID=A0A7R8ZM41_9CRUS|nr:unnamed protein product [Cyprideis torosa]CAG0888062.1 unnamed protein product [Cyprideis torosa]